MRKGMPKLSLTSFIVLLLLVFVPVSFATTPPALRIADNLGNVATIDSTGTVVFSGACTGATCTTTAISVSPGQIDWAGTLGTFSMRAIVGVTKPYSIPTVSQDLNLQHVTTSADGTLTVQWTDTDFNYTDITGGSIQVGGVLTGGGTSTYSTYFDNTNAQFGTGILVGTLGPFSSGSFNGGITGPGPTASPFSMTEVVTLNLTANSTFGVDFAFLALPAPLHLTCAASSGQVGVPYSSSLMASGGISPYTFSIISGNLPSGLSLNPTTGAITGAPTQGGTFSFTAQVVDSSGNVGSDTVTSSCSIVVTAPPPITLACAGATGEVGVPYSSALVANGGIPPYTYSISSGVLPTGLTLNVSTGAITGIPSVAGPFSFTAQVHDSTNTLAGTTTSNCGITINPPPSLTCLTSGTTGEVGLPFNSPALSVSGGSAPYTFSVATGTLPAGLSLNPSTGAISGTPSAAGTFTIKVTDANGAVATGTCPYTINSPPSLTCLTAGTTGEVGVPFSSPALSVTGGTAPYTFSVATGTLPAGLTLNPSTGAISGTPSAAGTFTIKVTDANGSVASGTCPYTINSPPSLTCLTTGTTGEVGVPFSSPALSVTGGTAPYTFSVATGTLPAGLTLNPSTGAISGTPSAAGTFTIKVTDANGSVASGTCPYTINSPPSLTCLTTGTTGEVGVPFSSPALSVTGGTAPYTFSVATGTLPAGLTLNPSTGAISGTPTAAGTFTIKVTDANGSVASGTCPYTINSPPSLTCLTTGTTGEVGVPFSSPALSVTGGTAPYTFSVATGTLPAGLTLNPSTGAISGTPTAAGTFTIKVTDANGSVASGTCPYTINSPPSLTCLTTGTTGEVGVPFSSPALSVTGGTAPYTFSVATGTLPAGLSLNSSTGAITGTPTAAGSFTIKVTDANGAVASGTCPYTINSPPSLTCLTTGTTGEVGVPFSSPALTVSGGTAPYTFSVATGTLPAGLTLNPSTGTISGTPSAAGTFTIKVTDANGAVATGTCPYTINSPPSLTCLTTGTTGEVGVPFSSPALTVTGGTAPYTFSVATGTLPAGLTLNSSTGAISGTPTAAGTFTIKVTDANGAVATGTCPYTINSPPSLTCLTTGTTGEVGVPFSSPALTVSGGTAPYTFSVATGTLPAGLTLNPSTGTISGTPSAAGTFTIKVTDANGAVATGTCPYTINSPPSLTCLTTGTTGEVGVPFSSPALTVTGGTAPYTFSVATGTLPAGLTLNSSTGAISGTPTAAGTFTIKVTDANGAVATGTCPYTINSPPSLTCLTTGTTGEVGVPFSSPALTVSGGTAPYTFSVATGTLPAGLTLNSSTGAISGTPTAAGSFTIKVTDANGAVASGTCPYTINSPPSLTCLTTGTTGEVGVPFSSPALTVSGGTAPYTFSVATGTLPAGLTLNPSTGTISGTPSAAGTFTIKVTDANGAMATGTCPYTINSPPSLTCLTTGTTGEVGVPFSSPALTVSGGTAPYTFSVATGTLPAGLTLNPSTGAISGTPSAAGSFTIKVTDANGAVATGTCPYTINSPPSLTCLTTGTTGEVGVPFSSPAMTVTGGTAPYTFSVATGTLPAGLTLNPSTGAISGTPSAAGTFTLKVTDANGAVASGTCPYTINSPPSLTCLTTGTTGEVGVPFSSPALTVSGGTAPYTFSVATGTLPAGLTLNPSTGAISGTPTAAGSFTIKVTDANGAVSTGTCPYTINPPPSLTCLTTGTTGEVGVPFSSPAMTVSGGTAPYTFSVATGTLPAGLTLNPSTGAISGTPSAAGTFTIKVTDANGAVATGTCPYTINPAISATCVVINASKNVAITPVTMTASGGTGTGYTFSATGLPTGLTMASNGTISGTPTVTGTFPYTVTITDSAGNKGTFNCSVTVGTPVDIECGSCTAGKATSGTPYSASLSATGGTAPYTFSIISGSLPPGLTLNASTGAITGTPTTPGSYTFTSKVTDKNNNTDTITCTIVVVGPPIDLECGTCVNGKATVGMSYSAALLVNGGTAPFTFSIISGSLPPGLTLNTSTGAITGSPTTPGTYSFTSKVVDKNGNWDTASCTIVVAPSPINLDCGPCAAGKANVGTAYSAALVVTGGKPGFTFSIISGALPPGLNLNTTTGTISGTPTTAGTYTFTSKVVDANGATDTDICTIVVSAPPVNLDCGACGTSSAKVGSPYSATLSLTGGKGPYTFSIISGSLPPGLYLNTSTGTVSGTPTTSGSFTFTSKVVDAKGATDTATCTIVVAGSPINLDCGTCGAGKATVGVAYTAQYTVSGGTGPFTYSLFSGSLPPGLSIGSSTGKITGTPTQAGTFSFTAKVVDYRGNTDTQLCTIVVVPAPIDLECGSCGSANGSVNMPYSATLSVVNGTGPFTFSIISGSLPPGLTLNSSTGVISGTPTTAGTYTWTSKVVDGRGNTDTQTCTLIINTVPVNLECGSCGTGKATVGTAYSAALKATGGSGSYTYSITYGSLPPGLTLNTSTGVISGTPTTAGSYTVTSKVVDSKGKSDTSICTFLVVNSPVNLDCGPCSASKAKIGTAYSATMVATGGAGSYTYSVTSGSLPPGLTLNSTTGKISGTPTQGGTFTFTSKAVDKNGNSDTDTCTIVVAAPPVYLNCGSCGASKASHGKAYSSTMSVTGGSGSFTFSIISGSLPTGLTLNSTTGIVSGTPTTTGTYTFTSKVVDSNGSTDTTTCTILVY